MKKLFILLGAIAFLGCSDDGSSDVTSNITYLPLISLTGDTDITLACGSTSFTDPGAEATEGGTVIPLLTEITAYYFGSASIDGPDIYDISYSATNVDGIPGSAFRHIVNPPCNDKLTDGLAGTYSSHVVRSNGEEYDVDVYIKDLGSDMYQISDLVGGFYDQGRGYGPGYACLNSVVTVNNMATNDFSFSQGAFPIWGNTVDITSFSVDAGAGTISIGVLADFGGVWNMTLTQV